MPDPNHQNINQNTPKKKLKSYGLPRDMLAAILFFPAVAVVAMIATIIIMPALNPETHISRSLQCQMNLTSIGRAIWKYQDDHKQKPPDLNTLIENDLVRPKDLLCPLSNDITSEISYIYRGSDLPKDDQDEMILAYDKKGNHIADESEFSRHVLFADFSVRRIELEDFAAIIDRDNELRRELGLPEKPDGK